MRTRLTLLASAIYLLFGLKTTVGQSLPAGWSHGDIGTVGVSGSASYSNGVFTVSGAGPQIWGTADGFHFVYQPMAGDGTIVARVVSVTGMRSGTSAEVGVMIRDSLDASSANAYTAYRTSTPLVEFLWRWGAGAGTSYVNSGSTPLPYWVKMTRSGTTFTAFISPDGASWTQVGSSQTVLMATNVYIGLAVSSNDGNNNSLVTATMDNVSLTSTPWTPPAAPWLDQDIGSVGVSGNVGYSNGAFTICAAGPQIGGTADGFHFVYQPMAGDGTIVARVVSVTGMGSGTSAEVGVMIRESLSASSTDAYTAYRTSTPLAELLWRSTTGGSTSNVNSGATPLPYWVRMSRSGSTFTASISPDGVNWTQVGTSQTISMASNVYIGLAVSSNDGHNWSRVSAIFDNVSVSTPSAPAPTISSIWPTRGLPGYDISITGSGFGNSQGASIALLNGTPLTVNSWSGTSIIATIPAGATSGPLTVLLAPSMNASNPATFAVLPAGWLDQDVGAVGLQGNASYSNGAFTISAAGPQIYGTADGFHFVYQPLSGDGTIVARVVSVMGMQSGTSAEVGVMIRESLNANSANAYTSYRTATGSTLIEFLWRSTTGGSTSFFNSGSASAPYWVEIVRSGNTFTSYISSTGTSWTQLGASQTISMASNVYIGLAVSSCDSNNNSLVTATFDNVSVTPVSAQLPVITDINPFSGPVGASVKIYGANFGSQGASSVSFNGVAAGPGIWSPTAITVPVPYGATTGNIVVKANGLNSNGVPFAVFAGPTITSVSPGSGPIGTPVTITGTNFGPSQGSSTVKFSNVGTVASSWSPTSIVANVPSGAITGGVVVTVSGVPSNITSFTVTSTGPSISNLIPASGPTGTSVTINGDNFGTTTGSVTFACGTFRCHRPSGSITNWTSTSIVVAVPTSAVTGSVYVYANTAVSNPAAFTVYTVQAGSASLTVNPSNMNMVVGQTQAIQLLDQNGLPFTSPAWSIANSSIAAIVPPVNQGDPTLLQANAVGNTTLTGTSPDGRTGSAQVSILAGTSLPVGTVQWDVPSLGTAGITRIVQAGPTFYVFDQGANGGSGAFRAFTVDGQQKWMFAPSAPANEELALLAADDQGGFVYQRDDWSDSPMLGRVDENGNQSWLMSTPLGIASNVAISLDGTVYFVQQDYLNTGNSPTAVVALDELSGQMKFAVPLPTGTYTGTDYTVLNDPNGGSGGDGYPAIGGQYCTPGTSTSAASTAIFGNLTISSGGIVYLPISTGALSFDAMPCDSSADPNHPGYPHLVKSTDGLSSVTTNLQVMAIQSNGTYSLRPFDSFSASHSGNSPGGGAFGNPLGGATPDGNGGTLLAVNGSGSSLPSAFYHDTGSAVTKLTLSFNPAGEILTGGDGTAYLSGTTTGTPSAGTILAVSPTTNTIKWTYTSTGGNLSFVAATNNGSIAIVDAVQGLIQLDPSGNASLITTGHTFNQISYSWTDEWFARIAQDTGISRMNLPLVIDSASAWAIPEASPLLAYTATELPWFPPLPTCPGASKPCAGEATWNAFKALKTLMAGPSCSLCNTYVFSKLSQTQQQFSSFLNLTPLLSDGTRSNAPMNHVMCNWYDLNCQFGSETVAAYMAKKGSNAISRTPSASGPVIFITPGTACTAGTSPGTLLNEALLFHEALHGFTGLYDSDLANALGVDYATKGSMGITYYIENNVFGATLTYYDPGGNQPLICQN